MTAFGSSNWRAFHLPERPCPKGFRRSAFGCFVGLPTGLPPMQRFDMRAARIAWPKVHPGELFIALSAPPLTLYAFCSSHDGRRRGINQLRPTLAACPLLRPGLVRERKALTVVFRPT